MNTVLTQLVACDNHNGYGIILLLQHTRIIWGQYNIYTNSFTVLSADVVGLNTQSNERYIIHQSDR
jgi:hypothetical protein